MKHCVGRAYELWRKRIKLKYPSRHGGGEQSHPHAGGCVDQQAFIAWRHLTNNISPLSAGGSPGTLENQVIHRISTLAIRLMRACHRLFRKKARIPFQKEGSDRSLTKAACSMQQGNSRR